MKKAIKKLQKEIDYYINILEVRLIEERSDAAVFRLLMDIEGLQNAIVVLTEGTSIKYTKKEIHPEIRYELNGDALVQVIQ